MRVMETRRHFGPHRALRHIARGLARFAGPTWPLAPVAPPASPAPRSGLTACVECGGDHVCPMSWGESGSGHWWIEARCGDCGNWSETLISNAQAAALDVTLDSQQALIRAAADRLDVERMADEVDTFVVALERDLIGAADF
jgi:hypothetical protein